MPIQMERVLLGRSVRPFRSLRSNVLKRGSGNQSSKPSGRLRTSAQARSFSIVPLRSVSEGRCQTRAYHLFTYDIALLLNWQETATRLSASEVLVSPRWESFCNSCSGIWVGRESQYDSNNPCLNKPSKALHPTNGACMTRFQRTPVDK